MVELSREQLIEMFTTQPLPKSVPELRAMLAQMEALFNTDLPEVGAFHEGVLLREIDGARVTADIAVPKGSGPHPVLVYFHGGGWVSGSPSTHRKLGRQFAEAGFLTLNLDYRLAPEYPYPAAVEDGLLAVRWAEQNAARYGGDASRLAVGGDSAGGNLAAAVSVALAEEGQAQKVKAALLIYGVFNLKAALQEPSGVSPISLNPEDLRMMAWAYLGEDLPESLLIHPRVSPALGVQAGAFPPSFLVAGTLDPLLPQSQEMARALQRAGVEHELRVFESMPHAFLQMSSLPECGQGIELACQFLRRYLAVPS